MGKKITNKDFIRKSIELHNYKYDYSKVDYIEYIKQKSFEGCVYKNKMQFDFFLPDFNLCIEFDGIQHFRPIEYFGGINALNEQINKDNIKNKFCYNNNIKLIRIPYYEYDNIEKILNLELCQ